MTHKEYVAALIKTLEDGMRVFATRDGMKFEKGQIEERARNMATSVLGLNEDRYGE